MFQTTPVLFLGPQAAALDGRFVDDKARAILNTYDDFYQVQQEKIASQRLQAYLQEKIRTGDLTMSTAILAARAWAGVWAKTKRRIPIPDACPGPNGQLLYCWDTSEHHLELEVFPSGDVEMFYRNRTSGELWEYEYVVGEPLPAAALRKLLLFA